jgi:thermitase
MKIKAIVILVIFLTSFQLTPAQVSRDPRPVPTIEAAKANLQVVQGRALVKFRASIDESRVKSILKTYGLREQRKLKSGTVRVLLLPAGMDERELAQRLRALPEVEFAEPDYQLPLAGMVPNDPLFASEWHLPVINASDAWAYSTGSNHITIAICDTGIDATQPDLAAKLVPGWNVADNNADTSPIAPHGTWVAGTAAAASDNSIGVAAPAMNCRLMPLRVTSSPAGFASVSNLADAACWAADHGARVINLSYSGYGSPALSEAAKYVVAKQCVFVMAAGNDGHYVNLPDDPNIISVSATTQTDSIASFSATGPFVDISAPGSSIMTTGLSGTYLSVGGTSFSAPLVAAAAAMILSLDPSLTPSQVEGLLKVSATDLGPADYDTGYGYGRLNLGRALQLTKAKLDGDPDTTAPEARFTTPGANATAGQSTGEMVQIDAVDDVGVAVVYLLADGVTIDAKLEAPFTFNWDTSGLAVGTVCTLMAIAKDEGGNTTRVSLPVTVTAGVDVTPPTVRILSPGNKERVQGTVSVYVNAADNTGTVTYVELYVDGVFVAFANTVPYTIQWTSTGMPNGIHALTCKAYDWAGNIGLSNTVNVVIK